MGILEEIGRELERIAQRKEEAKSFLDTSGFPELAESLEGSALLSRMFHLRAKSLKELRMAAIMDQFTLESYRPECVLKELTPDCWQQELEEFKPDLVFIESAWQGKDKLWYRKIDRPSKELYELSVYCHEKEIPVIFWNKEDPIYTTQFMTTASLADVVFTTDIDCIQRYKNELGHNQVYHLHFAAQPTVHNPVEKYQRKDKFCFAGAYYHKYKKRAEVFDKFSEIFLEGKGFDIYDRNYKSALPEHAFPERYDPYILGRLEPSQIDVAYKGYTYGVNMNSVQQSQSMFARRVFEMLASNTITVGNYSRGVKNYFGDLTICTDDERTLAKYLQTYCTDEQTARKYRLLGLRKVLSEDLYEDRLDYIVQKVFGKSLKRSLPSIAMVARCADVEQAKQAVAAFQRQDYSDKQLYLLGDWDSPAAEWAENERIHCLSSEKAMDLAACPAGIDFYACLDTEAYYGKNYLKDLALTLRYRDCQGIGKAAHYTMEQGAPVLHEGAQAYHPVQSLRAGSAIVSSGLAAQTSLWDLADANRVWEAENLFAADEFNYCGSCSADSCPEVEDLVVPDLGLPLNRIEAAAEHIRADLVDDGSSRVVRPKELQEILRSTKQVKLTLAGDSMKMESSLPQGTHEYLFATKSYPIAELAQGGKLAVKFQVNGSLDCICVCMFLDEGGNKIAPQYPRANAMVELELPPKAHSIRLGFRPKGEGECVIKGVTLGKGASSGKGCFLSRSNVLVLTNQYPSPESLYRNMFVHRRVECYREAGLLVDVMRMNVYCQENYWEFEGVNGSDGQLMELDNILENGNIDTVCVHFLDEGMWEVLRNYAHKLRILVWTHGIDIQPWHRRMCNYGSDAEIEQAKRQSAPKEKFWQKLFSQLDQYPQLHFVFVSQIFANEVFEDYHVELPKDRYSIIPNCVDTELFCYRKKDPEQRKKLLSIRPYVSNNYGNDLTVKCIQELAQEPWFNELDIRIIGSGVLFDSTVQPLKKYPNVTLEKRFLRQDEIAAIHKEYGVLLVPTRLDTQGVSRDEAMAGGLVPVTNAVQAVPEFVDDDCAILVPPEDYKAMAQGIRELYASPEKFCRMSENAVKRVFSQTSREFTVDKEIALIRKD